MNKPIKELLKAHYHNQHLSPQQRQQLELLQRNQSQLEQPKLTGWQLWLQRLNSTPGYAYATVCALAIAWLLFPLGPTVEQRVVEEIAYNHNKQMQMEILSPDLSKVQVQLRKLDFSMVQSSRLPKNQWQLVGGRYCSIQGKLAAQLRLSSSDNQKRYTLYQALIPKGEAQPLDGYQTHVQGVNVSLWIENGILFGLASSD